MKGKIGLEEHFAIPETIGDSEQFFTPDVWPDFKRRLLDLHDQRLADMDRHGIEFALLSLNSPSIQAMYDRQQAVAMSRRANEVLAGEVARRPDRFAGLAALPMQDPEAATAELRRAVTELGLKGALVNGFSQVEREETTVYYDLPQYWPFWEEVQRLDVPFYLHPRDTIKSLQQSYDGHPWLLGSAWGFSVETATHALRLMGSGLFDRYPQLTIILGHLGEMLPTNIWRTSHRLTTAPRGLKARLPFSEYLRKNFYVTTSGNFRTPTLLTAMIEIGSDRILFSTDYPFETMADAATWFDTMEISESEREKMGRTNAKKLFKLDGLA